MNISTFLFSTIWIIHVNMQCVKYNTKHFTLHQIKPKA
jgi:hypothetical protein